MFGTSNGDQPSGCVVAWFALCAVIALVVIGVFVWAVIAVVSHITG